jgi:hemolysin activation/secretion protein
VRGYPEGDFLADTGAIVNFDWIFPMYILPESLKLPYSDVPMKRQFEPVVFMDLGGGRLNKQLPLERRDKFLMGIGGGIRVRLYKNVFCRFEWAKAVGARPTGGAGPSSFNVSIQTEL